MNKYNYVNGVLFILIVIFFTWLAVYVEWAVIVFMLLSFILWMANLYISGKNKTLLDYAKRQRESLDKAFELIGSLRTQNDLLSTLLKTGDEDGNSDVKPTEENNDVEVEEKTAE